MQWRTVPSNHHHVDVVCRGVFPGKLMDVTILFHRLMFLHGPEANWSDSLRFGETEVEKKDSKTKLALP